MWVLIIGLWHFAWIYMSLGSVPGIMVGWVSFVLVCIAILQFRIAIKAEQFTPHFLIANVALLSILVHYCPVNGS